MRSVAVVTPTMNRQDRHASLYKTFSEQTHPRKHLYVLDESKTPSPFFTRKKDPRVTYVHRKARSRVDGVTRIGESRNFINSMVNEDVIAHFDDDDLYDPSYLEMMVDRLGDADLAKLDVWRCLHEPTGIVFEWDTRSTGGEHFAIQGQSIQRVDVDPDEMGPDMGPQLLDAFRIGFAWSYVYPRSTWEQHPFPLEGTEDIPWVQGLREAGGRIEFVSDRAEIALHTVHVDPNHPHGGSPHFPQRQLGAAGGPRLVETVRRRMIGAMASMTALPDGKPLELKAGALYSILARVKKRHTLRMLTVRAEAWGAKVQTARDNVAPSEFELPEDSDSDYRLIHFIGTSDRDIVLPWKTPSFIQAIGDKTGLVKAWVQDTVGSGAARMENMVEMQQKDGDVAIIPGATYLGSALVKNAHSKDFLGSLLSRYGVTISSYQESPANRGGYKFVDFTAVAGPKAGGMLPWKAPWPLSWIDDTHLVSIKRSSPVGSGQAQTFDIPEGYAIERVVTRLSELPPNLTARVAGSGAFYWDDEAGSHVVQSPQTGRLAVTRAWTGIAAPQTPVTQTITQGPTAAQTASLAANAKTVAGAIAAFNATPGSAPQAPSYGSQWQAWGSGIIGNVQAAYAAAQAAQRTAQAIAQANPAASDSAQSVGSSLGEIPQLISALQAQTALQGTTYYAYGQFPPLAAVHCSGNPESCTFSPSPEFTSTARQALQYAQGAVAYAQEAAKQAAVPVAPVTVHRTPSPRVMLGMGAAFQAPVETQINAGAIDAADVAAIVAAGPVITAAQAAVLSSDCGNGWSWKCFPTGGGNSTANQILLNEQWPQWQDTLIGHAQDAANAAESATQAALAIAAIAPAALYSAQSAGSSSGDLPELISSAAQMQGWTVSYDFNGNPTGKPAPALLNALNRIFQYAQGAVAYAQAAVRQATPVPVTPDKGHTIVRRFGSGASSIAIPTSLQNISDPFQTLSPDQVSDLQDWAEANGAPVSAVTQYTAIGSQAFSALSSLASASSPQQAINDVTPLVAIGLAALSASPVVGVAVMAGLAILSDLLGDLFPSSTQTCLYTLPPCPQGKTCAPAVCCNAISRPYGPQDSQWVTVERFDWNPVGSTQSPNGDGKDGDSAGGISWELDSGYSATAAKGAWWCAVAFTWWQEIGMELYALGDQSVAATDWSSEVSSPSYGFGGAQDPATYILSQFTGPRPTGGTLDFTIAFDKAFVKLYAEPVINGFPPLPMQTIINTIVGTWNLGRSSESTHTFSANDGSFFGYVLAGNIDGQDQSPVTVNTGAALGVATTLPLAPSGGSNAAKIAAATVGVAAVGAVGAAVALGHPWNHFLLAGWSGASRGAGVVAGGARGLVGAAEPRRRSRKR